MIPPQDQPDSDSAATYFDPEEAEAAEEQFSASLETSSPQPQFMIDAPEEITSGGNRPQEGPAFLQRAVPPDELLIGQEPPRSGTEALKISQEAPDWRDQVSAKVSSYKSRRPQKERYPSLRLPFGPEIRSRTPSLAASLSPEPDDVARNQEPVPAARPHIVLESTARVIEFPRMTAPVWSDELAGPVMERPRIVEAPDSAPPRPALGGILIDAVRAPEPERRPGIDIPLRPAPMAQRLLAASIDGCVISAALAAFAYVFFRINGSTPPLRSIAEPAAGLLAVLWPAYQYGFLVLSGTTPGLRLAKLQVSCFDGTSAPRNLRRWRVLASLLSCASVGLGYAWCFIDEDQLSWHDRITKTHLAPRLSGTTQPQPDMLNS